MGGLCLVLPSPTNAKHAQKQRNEFPNEKRKAPCSKPRKLQKSDAKDKNPIPPIPFLSSLPFPFPSASGCWLFPLTSTSSPLKAAALGTDLRPDVGSGHSAHPRCSAVKLLAANPNPFRRTYRRTKLHASDGCVSHDPELQSPPILLRKSLAPVLHLCSEGKGCAASHFVGGLRYHGYSGNGERGLFPM